MNSIHRVTGIIPTRISLYKMAFMHKSIQGESETDIGNNERLEFLGDAILSTIVADYLYTKYPTGDEGFMTKMRSKIVKRKTLNEIASQMGVDIILSDFSTGNMSLSMMGNALEALIGAMYLELGYTKTKQYVTTYILRNYVDIDLLEEKDDNFKSQLLEYGQKYNIPVEFVVLKKFKFNKRDRFKIAVEVDNEVLGQAEDYNKKAAEQTASKEAMQVIKKRTKEQNPLHIQKAQ